MKKLLSSLIIISIFILLLSIPSTAYAAPQYAFVPCPGCMNSCLFTYDSNIQYRGNPPIPIFYGWKTWQCSYCRLYRIRFNSDCLGCGGFGRGNCEYTKEYVWPFGFYNTRIDTCYSCTWRYIGHWWSQS